MTTVTEEHKRVAIECVGGDGAYVADVAQAIADAEGRANGTLERAIPRITELQLELEGARAHAHEIKALLAGARGSLAGSHPLSPLIDAALGDEFPDLRRECDRLEARRQDELAAARAHAHELSMRVSDEQLAELRAADAQALEEERAAHATTKGNLARANALIEQLRAEARPLMVVEPDGSVHLASEAAVRTAIRVLNEALALDPEAISALLAHRVPCNMGLADHPTIQVRAEVQTGLFDIGALGLINGLLGTVGEGHGIPPDWGFIASETNNDTGRINRFVCTLDAVRMENARG